jgi:hypothetical protein
MIKKILFIGMWVLFCTTALSQENESCKNLAKLTCEHKDSIQAETKYNDFLETVKSRYIGGLEAGLKKYPLDTFLKKTGMAKPAACSANKASVECHMALRKEMVGEATEISNNVLGKPSKYSDPNVVRNDTLFSLFGGLSLQVSKELVEQKKSEIKRIETMFRKVKAAMIKNISNQLNEPEKTQFIARVSAIEFDSQLCVSENYPAEIFLTASASYEPKPHTFAACPRILLSAMNDAQLSFMIGHEMSHSIDPCRIAQTVGDSSKKKFPSLIRYPPTKDRAWLDTSSNPYGAQIKCLRQAGSAGAIKSPLTKDEVELFKQTGKDALNSQLCYKDQINESFADWMGIEAMTEVLKDSLKGLSTSQLLAQFASVYSTKCHDVEPGFDPHPLVERRANGILGVHPEVRKMLKCPSGDSKNVYCAPPKATSTASDARQNKSGGAGVIR